MSLNLYNKQPWSSLGHHIPLNTCSIYLFLFIAKNLKKIIYTSFFPLRLFPISIYIREFGFAFTKSFATNDLFLISMVRLHCYLIWLPSSFWHNKIFFPIWYLLFPYTVEQLLPPHSSFLASPLWASQLWCCCSRTHVFPICTYLLGGPMHFHGFSHNQCPGLLSPHTYPVLPLGASDQTCKSPSACVYLNASEASQTLSGKRQSIISSPNDFSLAVPYIQI